MSKNFYNNEVIHLLYELEDTSDVNIEQYFDEMTNFIANAVENGNILIHCLMGVSRSATSLIAYYVRYKNYKTIKAYKYIKKKRMIYPNPGF